MSNIKEHEYKYKWHYRLHLKRCCEKKYTYLKIYCERIIPANIFPFSDTRTWMNAYVVQCFKKECAFDDSLRMSRLFGTSGIKEVKHKRCVAWFSFIWQYTNIAIDKQFEFTVHGLLISVSQHVYDYQTFNVINTI